MLLNVLERHFVLLGVSSGRRTSTSWCSGPDRARDPDALDGVVGRVWCGWLCPQTIFMEMVFRRLEYLIEGSAEQQLRRDRAPWTPTRCWCARGSSTRSSSRCRSDRQRVSRVDHRRRRAAGDRHRPAARAPGRAHRDHRSSASSSMRSSRAFASRPACWPVPYGRVMSALVDAHRHCHLRLGRGASRAAGWRGRRAAPARRLHRLPPVCHGVPHRHRHPQRHPAECVNCTACIDACDDVMPASTGPTGLIRLTSSSSTAHRRTGSRHVWRATRSYG